MATLKFVNVSKLYDSSTETAVSAVDLEIDDGEFFVLLGPSGCGKSTLLKMVAGLEEATSGAIFLDDEMVNYLPPGRRNVAMVFQNYALYPHMTVRQNIAFPLRMKRTKRREAADRAREVARMLELDDVLDRPVSHLSGGQRQRVALGRALVREPRIMLMDEPLSNLDALLRQQTREELLRLHVQSPGTIVYVTHDQAEAMTMGDRIGVMSRGRLVQVGAPGEVYRRPANRFVAGFLGGPPMNLVDGRVAWDANGPAFVASGLRVPISAAPDPSGRSSDDGLALTFGVRPEDVSLDESDVEGGNAWAVDLVENLGAEQIVVLSCGETRLKARLATALRVQRGERVATRFAPSAVHWFDEDGARVDVLAAAHAASAAR